MSRVIPRAERAKKLTNPDLLTVAEVVERLKAGQRCYDGTEYPGGYWLDDHRFESYTVVLFSDTNIPPRRQPNPNPDWRVCSDATFYIAGQVLEAEGYELGCCGPDGEKDSDGLPDVSLLYYFHPGVIETLQ